MTAPRLYVDLPRMTTTGRVPRLPARALTHLRRLVSGASGRSAGIVAPALPGATIEAAAQPAPTGRHYRTIVGVDIAGFGRREEHAQDYVRAAMYNIVKQAFVDAGLPWPARVWRDDRGDGALLTVPPDIPPDRVIDPLFQHVHAGLRRHNRLSREAGQIHLRMAVHAGLVHRDDNGLSGKAILRLCRLLEAPAFKEAMATQNDILGLVVSAYLYDNVVQLGLGMLDPDSYTKLLVVNKETTTQAWLYLPSRAADAVHPM
jgi:hypothetical protein